MRALAFQVCEEAKNGDAIAAKYICEAFVTSSFWCTFRDMGASSAAYGGLRMSDVQRPGQERLDWEKATARARVLLAGSFSSGLTFRSERAGHEGRWAEPIQNAALRAIDRCRSGIEALPATTEELAVALAHHAKSFEDNRRARIRRQCRLMEKHAERMRTNPEAGQTLDWFQEIIARDLFKKFAARLFDALDLDARRLLEAWLGEGIEFSDTQAMMERLAIDDVRTIHNIKRRIRYKARAILIELTGDDDLGDST